MVKVKSRWGSRSDTENVGGIVLYLTGDLCTVYIRIHVYVSVCPRFLPFSLRVTLDFNQVLFNGVLAKMSDYYEGSVRSDNSVTCTHRPLCES